MLVNCCVFRSNGSSMEKTATESTFTKAVVPLKCTECKQLLDDPDLKMFIGDPEDAVSIISFARLCKLIRIGQVIQTTHST